LLSSDGGMTRHMISREVLELREETRHVRPKVVACIPAYNEERSIAKVILLAKKYADEIIVCDDGSTDMTSEIARALGAIVIKHPRNMGYGAALISLFRKALELKADVIITLDADGQHNPEEIPRLIQPILKGEADIVVGSRFIKECSNRIPFYRRLGIKLITRISNSSMKFNITDSQSGYRAYSIKALKLIAPYLTEYGMGISLEVLELANSAKLRVVEVPVEITYDVEKPSKKNPIAHGIELIMSLVKLISLERPITCLGLPSLAFIAIGMSLVAYLILLFNATRYFSVPLAIIALGAVLVGMILAMSSLTFYALSTIIKKIDRRQS